MSDREGRNRPAGFWSSMPGILTGLAALLTAIGALIIAIHPTKPHVESSKMGMIQYNTNRAGSDLTSFLAANLDDCFKHCIQNEQCKAIAFHVASNRCWLNGEVPATDPNNGYTSAVKESAK